MSRLGKKTIEIPQGAAVTVDGARVVVKGKNGELSRTFPKTMTVSVADESVTVTPQDETNLEQKALWGTVASHVTNMLEGVTNGFEKKLVIEGVGFKSEVKGTNLVMSLGFSHEIEMAIPEGLTVTAEKNVVTISGIDKELVGQFAADVRSKKKPEPYKGKGIRYEDETIRRKQGKKAV